MLLIRTILHPTDLSDCSHHARQMARSIAKDYGARLVVLHVAASKVVHAGPIGGPDETRPNLEELETKLRELFNEDLHTEAEIQVREGEPTSAILALADELHADLIVMGTTGGSGCGHLRLGGVAEEVIRRARQPVLTVRDPAEVESPIVPSLVGALA